MTQIELCVWKIICNFELDLLIYRQSRGLVEFRHKIYNKYASDFVIKRCHNARVTNQNNRQNFK